MSIFKPSKGGPGSGPRPGGYREKPSSVNPGRPRSGIHPRDLFPHGRNSDGTPKPDPDRESNDMFHAPKK